MSAKQKSCVVVICDGCESEYEHDYTPHFDSLDEGREQTECSEWWTDGADVDLCYHCKTKPHAFVSGGDYPEECGRCGVDKDEHEDATAVTS